VTRPQRTATPRASGMAAESVDNEINLEGLKVLKEIFEVWVCL
jgi:hypothetical protein